jgi:triphosphoribosyl-dephospho-CoA synthase
MLLEPLVHPKPGGVTRLVGHRDKDIFDFALHAAQSAVCLAEACRASAREGCPRGVSAGLRCYLERVVPALGLRGRNVALGSFMLALPLASALPLVDPCSAAFVEELVLEARRCVQSSGGEAGALYLEALSTVSPSHLRGSYSGPIPSVWERRARASQP